MQGNFYPPPPVSSVEDKLKAPAIVLIVTGALNAAACLLMLLGGVANLANRTIPAFGSDSERMGYYFGQTLTYGCAALSLLLSPLVIYGGVQMMRGKSYGLACAAAVIALLPCATCCFLIGMPAGIWALIVLNQADVKAHFGRA